ncbi:MAG: hypothetical protein ABR969_02550 [Sedimentisphaerales bacterium]|jgi:hypothetical protein
MSQQSRFVIPSTVEESRLSEFNACLAKALAEAGGESIKYLSPQEESFVLITDN